MLALGKKLGFDIKREPDSGDKELMIHFVSSSKQQQERRTPMIDKDELCRKIRDIYPDIGECGIDVDVAFDDANQRWVVDLKKGSRRMKTFLEEGDAEFCLQGRQCVSLGIEIGQLRDTIARR
jgi:hypothetical protein